MDDINISKLALLARIDLSSDEKRDLESEVETILGYVAQIKGVDVPKGE